MLSYYDQNTKDINSFLEQKSLQREERGKVHFRFLANAYSAGKKDKMLVNLLITHATFYIPLYLHLNLNDTEHSCACCFLTLCHVMKIYIFKLLFIN